MKIDIECKKDNIYKPRLKDLVVHKNGKVGVIYSLTLINELKIIVLSAFELEEEEFTHSKLIQTWRRDDVELLSGKITMSNE